VPEPETALRTCQKCGGEFEPRRMGRPRKFCWFCTPRSDEDKAAAAEHWAKVRVERELERAARAREQLAMLAERRKRLYAEPERERIQAGVGS
jgi:hypothetical protein